VAPGSSAPHGFLPAVKCACFLRWFRLLLAMPGRHHFTGIWLFSCYRPVGLSLPYAEVMELTLTARVREPHPCHPALTSWRPPGYKQGGPPTFMMMRTCFPWPGFSRGGPKGSHVALPPYALEPLLLRVGRKVFPLGRFRGIFFFGATMMSVFTWVFLVSPPPLSFFFWMRWRKTSALSQPTYWFGGRLLRV